MTSEFKNGQYLEWCTHLPIFGRTGESPVFFLMGNEWIFRLVIEDFPWTSSWCLNIYLDLKNKHTDFEPCQIKCQIVFQKGETLSLHQTVFEVSHNYLILRIKSEELCKKLQVHSVLGDSIKILFFFEDVTGAILKLERKTESETYTVSACNARKESSKSSKSSMNSHLEALSRDLLKMLDESSSFDVEITCEGKTFKCHRNVLETRSTVFSAMLKSDMVEGKTGLVKVEDIAAFIFESFLRYLYSGTLPELSIDAAKQFYEASDKYAVEELKRACSEFLTKNLSTDNACEILVLADQHSDENFRNDVIAYVVEKRIPQRNKEWSNFCKMHPILAIEVQNLYIQKHCPIME